jgi:hypothetical protein
MERGVYPDTRAPGCSGIVSGRRSRRPRPGDVTLAERGRGDSVGASGGTRDLGLIRGRH